MIDLRRSGTRVRSGVLTVTHLPDPVRNDDPPRVAFAVGRRVGGAVTRNLVRRRLRAVLRDLSANPGVLPSGSYLVAAQPRAARSTFSDLERDLRNSLSKIGSSLVSGGSVAC